MFCATKHFLSLSVKNDFTESHFKKWRTDLHPHFLLPQQNKSNVSPVNVKVFFLAVLFAAQETKLMAESLTSSKTRRRVFILQWENLQYDIF